MAINGKPTQEFIPIQDIRSGVIVLKNGSLRMILMTSSLNFGLKSRDEQSAIILQFQNMLNSLEFSIQIFVQSKRLDIRPYLSLLQDREKSQVIDNMKIQVHEYIRFIREFTERTNIMTKTFFIVVPFDVLLTISGAKEGFFSKKKKAGTEIDLEKFEEYRIQLEQRLSVVEEGLERCDLRTTRLGTDEITELFYRKFNPGELDSGVSVK